METKIENIKLNYEDNEMLDKESVILLHGWGANIDTMLPISNLIKDRYRVILLDMPGFGKSSEPKEVLDSFDYARIVLKFMDYLDVDRAIFIGHSFGGKVSSIIASQNPEKVEKLILIDSAGVLPKRGIDYYIKVYSYKLAKWIHMRLPFPNKEERLEKFRKKHGSDDYQAASGTMRKILVTVVNENIRPLLSNIDCETLLIWGENDDATPLYMAKVFEEEIENSGLVVLEGAGHYSYLDDYYTFSAVINSFL